SPPTRPCTCSRASRAPTCFARGPSTTRTTRPSPACSCCAPRGASSSRTRSRSRASWCSISRASSTWNTPRSRCSPRHRHATASKAWSCGSRASRRGSSRWCSALRSGRSSARRACSSTSRRPSHAMPWRVRARPRRPAQRQSDGSTRPGWRGRVGAHDTIAAFIRAHAPPTRSMRSLQNQALLLIDRLRPTEWQRTLVMAAVIGVLASAATIGFREGLFLIERLVFGRSDGLVRIAESLSWPARLAAPAVGGVIAGFLLAWSRRVSGQKPAGDYMEAIVLGDGDLPVRVSLIRALSSAASVASGGAIGREGPMVQLAALCGSLVGRWRRAPVPRRRLFVACAAAAGVATAYNAPIAGALFVAEIVLRSLAIESLGPLLVSAVAANLASSRLVGLEAVYHTSPFVLVPGEATLELALLGV